MFWGSRTPEKLQEWKNQAGPLALTRTFEETAQFGEILVFAIKGTAAEILSQFGWEIEDMGKAAAARAIEPLCMLWCIPGFSRRTA